MSSNQSKPTLREQTRAAVRSQIGAVALALFAEHGFDNVTVEQIAQEAGISARSFNRYFPTKEDAALGDLESWGAHVRDVMLARPAGEDPWVSLRMSYSSLLSLSDMSGEQPKRGMRVLNETPALRARNFEKHLTWAADLAPIVAERVVGDDARIRAYAIVQASIACFEAALHAWSAESEQRTPDELLQITFNISSS